jgi:hypothetical protein
VTVLLPSSIPSAAGWQLVDWIERTVTTPPASGGVATVQLEQLETDSMWLLDHMVAQSTSATPTRMRLYADAVLPGALLDGSNSGNFDVADWPAGLLVRPSVALVAQWTGCSDGAVGLLTLQGRRLVRA